VERGIGVVAAVERRGIAGECGGYSIGEKAETQGKRPTAQS
jgi:hypothetical protein